ncbi:MAG: BON domain-containing protein [Burkholderiales bacterium]
MNKLFATTRMLPLAAAALLAACGDDKPAPAPASPPASAEAAKAVAPAPAAKPAPAPVPAPAAQTAAPDSDKALAARVKAALEKALGAAATRVDVTVKNGAVTLWGSVDDDGERARMIELARKVPGVSSVQNKLQIVTGS